MTKLFGIPVGGLAAALTIVLVVVLAGVAALALRNRVFLRLGVRNVRRRRGRSVLIIVGLMLGTSIITAALATGDTMSHTIRSAAVSALGKTDEVVAAKGIEATLVSGSDSTGVRYFPERYVDQIAAAARSSGLVSGVAPVIVEPVAIQDVSSRQTEPRVTLFASDPARMRAFGHIRSEGENVSLAQLGPGEVFLNAKGADELGARPGDTVRIFAGSRVGTARVKAIVRYEGAATSDAGVMMPLWAAQGFLDKHALIRAIFVSNSGGVSDSEAVVKLLQPAVGPLGLETDKT
jgi:putative ABC transport system permease protein